MPRSQTWQCLRRPTCSGSPDGNKRVAFMGAYVFLGLNGYDLTADEADAATTIERVAAGRITEAALADWLRTHLLALT